MEAEAVYQAGNFDQAYQLAQQAAAASPNDATAWEILRKVAIAQTGDDYLRHLSDNLYQLPPENFLSDQVNGKIYFVVDVREPDEYAARHIEGATNIPLRSLMQHIERLPSTSTPILLYCHSQKQATHALVVLRELGYNQVYNLEGGISAYENYISNNPLPTPGPTPTVEPGRDPDKDGGC